MPQIVQGVVNASTLTGVDDVYISTTPPGSGQINAAPTNIVGFVGSTTWGPKNVAQSFGSGADILSKCGPVTTAAFDMATDIANALNSGVNNLYGVAVSDGTDVAGTLKINDSTGFASQTLTGAAAFSAGTVLSTTLTPVTGSAVTVAYTIVAGDSTVQGAMTSFANLINASSAVQGPNAFIQALATPIASVATVKALAQGAASNAIAITASAVGGTTTLTAGGATLLGGATPGVLDTLTARYTGSMLNPTGLSNGVTYRADVGSQSTTTSPTYKLTISPPFGSIPEVYDNLIAYATAGSGFDAPTFRTSLSNAVNGTPQLSANRPASSYFTAVVGASTAAPLTGTNVSLATNGSDGSTFGSGATFAQLGNDSTKTGMYALSGLIGNGCLVLCGNTDLANASAAQIAFASRENAISVMSFPTGTSTATAVANKALYGLASSSAVVLKDFIEFTDTVNNISARRLSPAGTAAVRIALTSPETSPANQRVSIVTGTERVGALSNQPYSPAEFAQLEAVGVNLISMGGPGGNFPMIRHNKNSLGQADPRGNIAYSRELAFIVTSIGSSAVLGQFVGQPQSRAPLDPLREKVRATLNDFFARLLQAGNIDSFAAQCDSRNNPLASIAAGALNAAVQVVFLGIVDKLLINIQGGQTVKITTQPQTTTANT